MDKRLKELHARIDEEYGRRHLELDEECRRDHEALDRVWPMLQSGLAGSGPGPSTQATISQTSTEDKSDGARRFFPVEEEVTKIVNKIDASTDIHQRMIFDVLVQQHSELRERREDILRGQIASVLSKLASQGHLTLVKKALGGNPAIYRKKKTEGQKVEPAAATAGSPPLE